MMVYTAVMVMLIVTFLQLWICFAVLRADFPNACYRRDTRYADQLPTQAILWNKTINTRAGCALRCFREHNCSAFFHGGRTCHAYSNRMHNLVSNIDTENMTYYENKGKYGNIAAGKPVTQTGEYVDPAHPGYFAVEKAVDGGRNPMPLVPPGSCAHTSWTADAWWQVDLQVAYYVTTVAVLPRADSWANQIAGADIRVSLVDNGPYVVCGDTGDGWLGTRFESFNCPPSTPGRFVRIQHRNKTDYLTLCEVEVYADGKP